MNATMMDTNDLLDAAEQDLIVAEFAEWRACEAATLARRACSEQAARVQTLRALAREMETCHERN